MGINFRKVNFSRVVKTCQRKHPNEPITKALVEFEKSELHRYFKGMRNRITHRLPFVTRGKLSPTVHPLLFPDDPESDDVTPQTESDIDLLETCREWLYEILSFVDQTSITVFQEIGEITAIDNKTGEKVDIYKRFKRE